MEVVLLQRDERERERERDHHYNNIIIVVIYMIILLVSKGGVAVENGGVAGVGLTLTILVSIMVVATFGSVMGA